MKLRAAVITDNLKLAQWQLDALEVADEELDVVCILNCLNTKIHRNVIKNFIYYLISFFSLRNKKTKSIDYKVENAEVISFESGYIKNWQTIPNKVINQLLKNNVEVVIKFGMNLVKIDELLLLCVWTLMGQHRKFLSRLLVRMRMPETHQRIHFQ